MLSRGAFAGKGLLELQVRRSGLDSDPSRSPVESQSKPLGNWRGVRTIPAIHGCGRLFNSLQPILMPGFDCDSVVLIATSR